MLNALFWSTIIGIIFYIVWRKRIKKMLHKDMSYGKIDYKHISTTQLKDMIESGMNVNERDNHGYNSLMIALTENCDINIVKLLVQSGASVNELSNDKISPLMVAAQCAQDIEIIKYLISCGADTKPITNDGLNLFTFSIYNPNFDICQMLFQYLDNVNYTDEEGNTPLILAAEQGNLACVELLLSKGAIVNHRNKEGKTALICACEEKQDIMSKIYEKIYASIKSPDVIAILLKNNADLFIYDNDGKSALNYASKNKMLKSSEVYKYMKELYKKSK